MKKIIIVALLALIATGSSWALDVPKLTGRVNDYANILTPDQRTQLEARLKSFEEQTSNQIVLLTIPSLEGEEDVAYGVKVFKEWKLGQKGKNNGVLWLHATKERRNRLEIGYGLEGALPDATCKLILRQKVAPQFKASNFFAGYNAGLDAIIAATKGEYQPDKTDVATTTKSDGASKNAKYWLFILPLFVAAFGGIFHRAAGGVLGCISTGLLAYWLFLDLGAVIIFGVIGFLVGLIAKDIVASLANGSSGGGGGGGFGGDSGGDSGSFSGGGGGSGGGGAGDSY